MINASVVSDKWIKFAQCPMISLSCGWPSLISDEQQKRHLSKMPYIDHLCTLQDESHLYLMMRKLLIIFKYCGLIFSISRKTHSRNIQYKVSDRVQCYIYPEEFILDSFPHRNVNFVKNKPMIVQVRFGF